MNSGLVKLLARDFPEDHIMCSDVVRIIKQYYPQWDTGDFYALTCDVRREKHGDEHREMTAERIFDEIPFFAQSAAQAAVRRLLLADDAGALYSMDMAVAYMVEILHKFFWCTETDIKAAVQRLNEERQPLSYYDESHRHRRLMEFIVVLRSTLWERGEVLRLREKEG